MGRISFTFLYFILPLHLGTYLVSPNPHSNFKLNETIVQKSLAIVYNVLLKLAIEIFLEICSKFFLKCTSTSIAFIGTNCVPIAVPFSVRNYCH